MGCCNVLHKVAPLEKYVLLDCAKNIATFMFSSSDHLVHCEANCSQILY